MSHLLSEPDNPNACQLTGQAAVGYRPTPTSGWQGSTHTAKTSHYAPSVAEVERAMEPSAVYSNDNYNHPDMPVYNKPDCDTEGGPVTSPANYWQKIAEASAPPANMSITEATAKANSGSQRGVQR